jgi:hypothetical protein
MCDEALRRAENIGPGSARRNLKNDTIAASNWYDAVPGLDSKVVFLAWKHRRERPIIVVKTPSTRADAVPEVSSIPRAQWHDGNMQEEVKVLARAFFARSDFREDNDFFVILSVAHGDAFCNDVFYRKFVPEIRLVHGSALTLTTDAFAAEMLRRQRFLRNLPEIIVRLHGLVGAAHLNGREGALRGRDQNNSERFTVRLDSEDGKNISVHSRNYAMVQRPELFIFEEF